MKTKPRKYQRQGVRRISKLDGRVLLADEMGLGKTYQSLAYFYRNRLAPCVVVCPAAVKWNWQREIRTHCGLPCTVLEGRSPNKGQPLGRITVINYDILHAWLWNLKEKEPVLVILDEVQYIKNRDAKRTKAVQILCKGVPKVLALSGTPLTNRPAELWPTLNLLRPKEFSSFWKFAIEFCGAKRTRWGWDYSGSSNLQKLHRILSSTVMIRRLKKDVIPELPEKDRQVVTLDLQKSGRKEYARAEADFIRWLSAIDKAKAQRAKKAKELLKQGYLKRLATELKMKGVLDWTRDFLEGSDRKLILFGIHKEPIGTIHKAFPKESLVIDGSVTGKKRQAAIDLFQNQTKKRLLIGNITAAGIGTNLTAASDLAFFEMAWTPGEHSQAEDRIHRIGQDQPVTCYYLTARNTIDEDLCLLLLEKQKIIEAVLDRSQSRDFNIFEQLQEQIRSRNK